MPYPASLLTVFKVHQYTITQYKHFLASQCFYIYFYWLNSGLSKSNETLRDIHTCPTLTEDIIISNPQLASILINDHCSFLKFKSRQVFYLTSMSLDVLLSFSFLHSHHLPVCCASPLDMLLMKRLETQTCYCEEAADVAASNILSATNVTDHLLQTQWSGECSWQPNSSHSHSGCWPSLILSI